MHQTKKKQFNTKSRAHYHFHPTPTQSSLRSCATSSAPIRSRRWNSSLQKEENALSFHRFLVFGLFLIIFFSHFWCCRLVLFVSFQSKFFKSFSSLFLIDKLILKKDFFWFVTSLLSLCQWKVKYYNVFKLFFKKNNFVKEYWIPPCNCWSENDFKSNNIIY